MKWAKSLIRQQPITGRMIKEDGTDVNVADLLADGEGDKSIAGEMTAAVFSVGNGATLRSVESAGLPLLSIRAAKPQKLIVPLDVSVFASSNAWFEVLINSTLVGASWVTVGNSSGVTYDISATSAAAGVRVASGYVVTAGAAMQNVGRDGLSGRLGLEYNMAVNTGDILTVFVKPFAGVVSASASVQWRRVDITA